MDTLPSQATPFAQPPDPKTRATKRRRRLRWAAALTVAAALLLFAGIIPDSPVFLGNLFLRGDSYDGRTTRYWIEALDNPDAEARRQAIHALGVIGPKAADAVPGLAAIMVEDSDRKARIEASLALSKMYPAALAALPALTQALEDEEIWVRMNAAVALSRLGPQARPAIPALIKALGEDRNKVYMQAFEHTVEDVVAVALGRASGGTADAVPALTESLQNAKLPRTRLAAAWALGAVGPPARPATPLLRTFLQDERPEVRWAVEESLRKIEGELPGG
jgi:HEAT repeat protein